jgi:hypothetical protein
VSAQADARHKPPPGGFLFLKASHPGTGLKSYSTARTAPAAGRLSRTACEWDYTITPILPRMKLRGQFIIA